MYIYMLEIEEPDGTLPTELLAYVTESRQKKIFRYKFNIDRLLSLYGALIVTMGISQLTGLDYNTFVFDEEKYGKPYLKNIDNIHFNLSHTRNYILCGVSFDKIGVDVENYKSNIPYNIMNKVFHIEEINYINSIDEKAEDFFKIWTRKEAFVKHNGQGLNMDLTRINTLECRNEEGGFTTWKIRDYICSVYSELKDKPTFIPLSIHDIYHYFIN